jgi:hypothetical protein
MTAVEALSMAHAASVQLSLACSHIRYRSRGARPTDVIEALRAAKLEIVMPRL